MIGKQGDSDHYMIVFSSEIAEYYRTHVCTDVREGRARCTRFDVQVTLEQPDNWSQMGLAGWVDGVSGSMRYEKSQSGKNGEQLATVYHGSRKSDRFARIYQKQLNDGDVCLRFEIQHNKKRANKALIMSCDEMGAMGGMIAERVNKLGHVKLRDAVMRSLGSVEEVKVTVRVDKGREKKMRWFKEDIIPLLMDEIRIGDEISDGLFKAFYDAIRVARIEATKRN